MTLLAWIGAIAIGLTLGLLGSGGSILTVPVLMYVVGQEPKVAIAGSLAIVAIISFFTLLPYAKNHQVHWHNVWLFGIPSMVGAVFGAKLAHVVSDEWQLMIFAVLMLSAAYLMFKPFKLQDETTTQRSWWKIALDGLVVGAVTGLVGVGGGFLIIPALVLLGGLSMHMAIGTSLVIIALKSVVGYVAYLDVLDDLGFTLDLNVILTFAAVGVLGGFLGHRLSQSLNQTWLKKGFAVFLLLMGGYILTTNLWYMG